MVNNNGKYAGMTVNERSYEAGIIEDWGRAASSKNRDRMIELLGEVELADQSEQIADLVLGGGQTHIVGGAWDEQSAGKQPVRDRIGATMWRPTPLRFPACRLARW